MNSTPISGSFMKSPFSPHTTRPFGTPIQPRNFDQSRTLDSLGTRRTPGMRQSDTPSKAQPRRKEINYAKSLPPNRSMHDIDKSQIGTPSFTEPIQRKSSAGYLKGNFSMRGLEQSSRVEDFPRSSSPDFRKPVEQVSRAGCTVIVFGFPQGSVNSVMDYFMKFGDIETMKPEEGNWIKVTYFSPEDAASALSANGEKITPVLRVGVVADGSEAVSTRQARVQRKAHTTVNKRKEHHLGDTDGPTASHSFFGGLMEWFFG